MHTSFAPLFRPGSPLNRRPRWRLALAVLGLCAFPAQAEPVRLTGLLELAMNRHPSVLQARSQAQAARHELDAAQWGRYPTLSTELRSDASHAQSLAKVEQPLWAGGRITERIALGHTSVRAAEAGVREAQFNALTQAGTAFFEVLRLSARLQASQDNVREHQRLVELISRRVQAQISPPADATLAQARLQQAISERLQIQRQLETTRNSLTQWTGPLDGELVEPARIDFKRAESDQWVEQVLQASAQRQRLLALIDGAQVQIRLARAQGLPTVVAGYQHIVAGPLGSQGERGRGYIGLQFQPGAGLSALAGVQAALSRKDAAEQELQVIERSLQTQARTLHSDIEALQAQLAPAQFLQDGTSELVDSYLRQYQAGRKNWLDVLNALREKSQALYNLADVRYALLQSQLKLLLLTGELQGPTHTVIHE